MKHNVSCKRKEQGSTEQSPSTSNPKVSAVSSMLAFVKRRSLNEELARLVANDGFSVNGITKSEFIRQSFANKGMKMPNSQTTVMKLIRDFYDEAKCKTMQEIQKRITDDQMVSLTLDEWTSVSNERYLNINIHFMDGYMINLGLVAVSGSLPAERIVEEVKKALKSFNIKPDNVFGATTDGAAVMIKFGKSSGYWHQLCYNHGLHLAVCDVLYKNAPASADSDSSDEEEADDDNGSNDDELDLDGDELGDKGKLNVKWYVCLNEL